jgi:hypothetical protein
MNLGPGIKGNDKVVTVERTLDGDFNEIKVSNGLDVYLTQDTNESLSIQADENLHDIIITSVENNVLSIYTTENINYAASRKVMVSFSDISKIKATSGSDVYSTNTIKAEALELSTTSGSDMELEIEVASLSCDASSGSDLKLSGTADYLVAEASSGSDIKAGNLITKTSNVSASSGADITVNATKELIAKSGSGGDVKYYGKPEKVEKNDSTSGSIKSL